MSRPKRALGQNFLVDRNIQRKIVDAVDPRPDQTVLEIGPGRGALTELLAERTGRLVLVELDDELAASLENRYSDCPRVRVIHRDVLELSLEDVTPEPERLRVVGNIPYNITTPIVFHLLGGSRPADITLMVQSEVADRMMAEPGTSGYGALTVGVRSVARVERLMRVSPGAFRPRPRVESTVLRIEPIRPTPLEAGQEKALRHVTRAVFQWRRKQLKRTLRDHPDLQTAPDRMEQISSELDLRRRPETLSPAEFIGLSDLLFPEGPP